jgi:hydrogenase maturation protease
VTSSLWHRSSGSTAAVRGDVVVAGIGNEHRRDDGVGPAVAARVATLVPRAQAVGPVTDPLELLGLWDGADLAVVIDASRSGTEPGTVGVFDMGAGASRPAGTSTHGLGVDVALRLTAALGRGPRRVVVVGVEGDTFGTGVGLSAPVAAAVPLAVRRVVEIIEEVLRCA